MKVLIIAESEQTVSSLKALFKTQGSYETITYSLLMKALDNIGEISPTIIVISAVDYPRHWKVFMQYVNAIYTSLVCDVVLIVDKKFDTAEKEKSEALGVWKTLSETKLNKYIASAAAGTVDFMDVVNDSEEDAAKKVIEETPEEIQEKIKAIVPKKNKKKDKKTNEKIDEKEFDDAQREEERLLKQEQAPSASDVSADEEPITFDDIPTTTDIVNDDDIVSFSDDDIFNKTPFSFEKDDTPISIEPMTPSVPNVQLLFVHPGTGYLVSGLVQEITDKTIVFKPDNKNSLKTFSDGQYISSASYKTGESIRLIDASVHVRNDTLELAIQEREAV